MRSQDLKELEPALQNFISRVCSGISSRKRRKEVLKELLTHVQEMRAEDSTLSAREIIARLGDPVKLEKQFAQANRTKIVRLLLAGLSVSVSLIVLVCAAFTVRSYLVERQKMDGRVAKINEHFDLLAADQAELGIHEFYSAQATGADAGEFLNGRFPRASDKNVELTLPPAIDQQLQKIPPEKRWEHAGEINLEGLDTSWMGQLKTFGFWDLTSGKEDLRDPDDPFFLIPSYNQVISWVSARLVQGIQQKKLKAAMDDVYHLLRLVYSNHTEISAAIASGLLHKTVYSAFQYGLTQGLVEEQDWTYPTPEQLARLSRVIKAMAEVLATTHTPPDKLLRLEQHPEWQAGLCAGLQESLVIEVLTSPFFAGSWPGEFDVEPTRQARQRLVEQNRQRCRLDTARTDANVWRLTSKMTDSFLEDLWVMDGNTLYWYILRIEVYLPYFRRVGGLYLASFMRSPDAFWAYEKKAGDK